MKLNEAAPLSRNLQVRVELSAERREEGQQATGDQKLGHAESKDLRLTQATEIHTNITTERERLRRHIDVGITCVYVYVYNIYIYVSVSNTHMSSSVCCI